MKDETLITLFRMSCGAAIMVASMITGVDGPIQMGALLLLGIPVERLKRE